MNADQMLAILRDGTPEQRRTFVSGLPQASFKDMALMMLEGRHPGAVVVALGPLITQYCSGADPEIGAPLALATHTLALEIFESGDNHVLLPMTLSGLAFQHVNALNLLGRSDAVLAFTARFIPYYEQLAEKRTTPPGVDEARALQAHQGEQQNVQSLKTARLGALVNLQKIDEGEEMLRDPKLRGNPASDVEIERLADKISDLTRRIFHVPGEKSTPRDRRTAMIKAVQQVAGTTAGIPAGLVDAFKSKVEGAAPTDASSPEVFKQLLEALRIGERALTGGQAGDNEWTLKRKVREASGIFVAEKTPAREKIEASLVQLEEALTSARAKGLSEVQNDALWGIYICHSRLAQPSEAADAAIALRQNLESLRARIADPVERGGVFSAYPHLSGALCAKLHEAQRADELLIAIEASKGRGIADILTQKASSITADSDIYRSAEELPSLTRRHGFHYLTYYVDTEKVYAVLVSKQGEIHLLPAIEMQRQEVRKAALLANPESWGRPLKHDASRRAPDVSETLAPLAGILEPLVDRRVLAADDHICYSPHDSFYNVPFHYLRFQGKHVADFFSTSRAHNAFQVALVLRRHTASRPPQFRGFIVPTVQDTRADDWDNREASLVRPLAFLAKKMRGEEYRAAAASLARVKSLDLREKVLHFSTHGIFPSLREAQNPFTESGLVMADGQNLPDEDALSTGERASVLTPEKVFYGGLDLRGSHVSVMACVSGLARDGLGGDALGMDWAFLQAGAASLLSSHWHVNAGLAAEFFCVFYQVWIGENKGRGEALRETVRRLRARKGNLAEPYSWAAFSLAGDWR